MKTLLRELPEHQRDIVLFALVTGLRQANITNLEWSQVDLARRVAWIHPDQAKARLAIHVSLNSLACAVLERQQGKHATHVFTYRGRPVKWVNTLAWREALQRAGIAKGFRWHSLRHTWASWLAQSGAPMNVLQEMGGWESAAMVRRYARLSPAQFAGEAESIVKLIEHCARDAFRTDPAASSTSDLRRGSPRNRFSRVSEPWPQITNSPIEISFSACPTAT